MDSYPALIGGDRALRSSKEPHRILWGAETLIHQAATL
jgi:hypothetical protein